MDRCDIIMNTELFSDIPREKVKSMFVCLDSSQKSFSAGQTVWEAGKRVTQVGIILSGKLYTESCDVWGNKSIITEYVAGSSFGEAYALAKNDAPVFDVVAKEDTDVVFLDIKRMSTPCSKGCAEHTLLIQNLLSSVASKSRELEFKINHICKRTTRDKLLSYLSGQAKKHGSLTFSIPFNRHELADYLCVERCAMSKELHRMKRDGLVDFTGSKFELRL